MTDPTDNLRKLLDTYYSGGADDDMCREIVRLFSGLPDIPPDLLVDYQIFMALEQLPGTLPPAPERLTRQIGQTIDSCREKHRRHRLVLLRWFTASGVAAALIAMLISIGGKMSGSEQRLPDHPDKSDQLVSETPSTKSESENEPAPNVELRPKPNPPQQLIAQSGNRPAKRAASCKKTLTETSSNHEITDPVEAARRLDAVFDILENNLSFSAKTQSEAFDALKLANEIASNILTSSLQ